MRQIGWFTRCRGVRGSYRGRGWLVSTWVQKVLGFCLRVFPACKPSLHKDPFTIRVNTLEVGSPFVTDSPNQLLFVDNLLHKLPQYKYEEDSWFWHTNLLQKPNNVSSVTVIVYYTNLKCSHTFTRSHRPVDRGQLQKCNTIKSPFSFCMNSQHAIDRRVIGFTEDYIRN